MMTSFCRGSVALLLLYVPTCVGYSIPYTVSIKDQSGLCLDLYNEDTTNGNAIQLWECNGHQSQLWFFEPNTNTIQYAGNPNKCIDAGYHGQPSRQPVEVGQLQIWDCNGYAWQEFGTGDGDTIWLAGGASAGLGAPLAKYCLDSYAPIKQGNRIQVWECNNYPQQLWSRNVGTSIRVDQSYEHCLDLQGGNTVNGNPVQLYPCNGLVNQRWVFDGSRIKYGGDLSKCVDASSLSVSLPMKLWECNGLSQQHFGFDVNSKTLYLSQSMSLSASNGSVAQPGDVNASAPLATLCLDVPQGDVTKGPDIWYCNGCWNQKWTVATCKYTNQWGCATQPSDMFTAVPDPARRPPHAAPPLGMSRNVLSPFSSQCPPHPQTGKPCTAVGGWPKFSSKMQLQNSKWAQYFVAVYGAVPENGNYPICLSDFNVVYTAEMKQAGVQAPSAPDAVGCPASKSKGAYYTNHGIAYPGPLAGAAYILQLPPFQASEFPNNAWVEVMHGHVDNDEGIGAWFYYLKGSGIWFNLGKRKVFQQHGDAYQYFKSNGDPATAKKAANPPFSLDSIVYLGHVDGGTCTPCCQGARLGAAVKNLLVEIVAVKLVGLYACAGLNHVGVKSYATTAVRSGWLGSKPCQCHETFRKTCFINCQGVPNAEVHLTDSRLTHSVPQFAFSSNMGNTSGTILV